LKSQWDAVQALTKRKRADDAFRANFEQRRAERKTRETLGISLDGTPMNPMKTFDPEKPCRVHDELNDRLIEWLPRWASLYREFAVKHDEGVIAWDDLLLDGWTEAAPR
jgi:hypothetical protein